MSKTEEKDLPIFTSEDEIFEWLQNEHYAEWCNEYGEHGYTQPAKGVILCNWNNVPKELTDKLKGMGFELEWSDEWAIKYDESKAYRTQPDSHFWEPDFIYGSSGTMLTRNGDHGDVIEAMSASDWHQEAQCVPSWITPDTLEEHGYVKWKPEYAPFESGHHAGQADDPEKIVKEIFEGGGVVRVVFRKVENSQSYVRFDAWVLYEQEEIDT